VTAPFKYAVLASGGGSNFGALLDSARRGDLSAEAVFVASNNSRSQALERAQSAHVPAYHISAVSSAALRLLESHGIRDRGPEERVAEALLLLLDTHPVHLLVLAGYMKKVPEAVLERMKNRVVNIHPALLPDFGGAGFYGERVHEAVVRERRAFSGMTVHMVNEHYDEGQVLLQRRTAVDPADDAAEVGRKVLRLEHDSYWRVLKGFADGEIVPTDSSDPAQAVIVSEGWKRRMRSLDGTVFP
jgi:phosphoribosylglycinamide formyltransferase-1